MPVASRHHELEARVGRQCVDVLGDRVSLGHRQRAAGGKVVLKVDDDEGLSHVRDDIPRCGTTF
jgi:hypothetical protein